MLMLQVVKRVADLVQVIAKWLTALILDSHLVSYEIGTFLVKIVHRAGEEENFV